jgi:protoporphyrinogen/coproporphyrinogen III oxidase
VRAVVVGGGISGLAAAWTLVGRRPDLELLVLEASPQVGGKLALAAVAGHPVDVGAEAMLARRPEGIALIGELGLAEDMITPTTTAASVWAGGAAHPLPARTMLGIPSDVAATEASGVLGAHSLAGLAAEPDAPPLPPLTDDIAVGALVRSRLGDEVVDRLVEPLLGGVYAGRADALSLRATMPKLATRLVDGGSLLAAASDVVGAGTRAPGAGSVFAGLRGGIGRLPVALAASGRFTVRTGVTVRAITRTPTGFALECGAVPVAEQVRADAVVVAAPAAKAARLLRDVAPAAGPDLAGIDYANLAIVSFAFAGVTPPAGSGLLVGAGERLATKAVTLTSQKWPVDTDLTVLRASVGRAGEHQALRLDDADLAELVRRELRPLLGLDAQPVDTVVTRWGGGLPQYGVGHVERVARIRAAVAAVPGLAVCGAAYDGVGIPACIATARAAVEQVSASRTMQL